MGIAAMTVLVSGQPGPGLRDRLGRIGSLLDGLRAWHMTRITRRALAKLSRHELDDIGLCRGDLERLTF